MTPSIHFTSICVFALTTLQACVIGCFYNPHGSTPTEPSSTSVTTTATTATTTTETSSASTTGEPLPNLPDPTVLQLDFSQIKQFDFHWKAAARATHYRLLMRMPGGADYVQFGADIVGESVSLTVPLHLRFGAGYIVSACNDDGCTDSEPVDVVDSMAAAVGYFKHSNLDLGDLFGYSLALSADGETLAVGAPNEDDDSVVEAGAVYIFSRSSGSWSQQARIKASNPGLGDLFGHSVDLSENGDTLVVGAFFENSASTSIDGDPFNDAADNAGAVYVFTRSADSWFQQAYIKASNTGESDCFGSAVALSGDGDTLAVGAFFEDSASTGVDGEQDDDSLDSGAVYVFSRSVDVWSQQAYVKASNSGPGDRFGQSVALSADGDTLAVGAISEDSAATGIGGIQADNSAQDAGAVYVFFRSADAWSQQAYVKASNSGSGDTFGISVALSAGGDTLAVGAIRDDSAATGIDGDQGDDLLDAGAVYVFSRSADAWSQQAYVKASNSGPDDRFGLSVALSDDGDTLAVGALYEASAATGIGGDQADNSVDQAGAAYVFTRAADSWSQNAFIKAPNTDAGDTFGHQVALSIDGEILAVGAPDEDSAATGIGGDQADNSIESRGAVYLY